MATKTVLIKIGTKLKSVSIAKRILIGIGISFLVNVSFFLSNYFTFQEFTKYGKATSLWIKNMDDEVSRSQKLKYTHVASVFFILENGDTIRDFTKDVWISRMGLADALKGYYFPLDSVIYSAKDPSHYMILSGFRNSSNTRSELTFFLIGFVLLAAWVYGMMHVFIRMVNARKSDHPNPQTNAR